MPPKKPLYQHLAVALQSRNNALENGNDGWANTHQETVDSLLELLPYGSGIEEAELDEDKSSDPEKRIVILSSYHLVNDIGFNVGYAGFQVIIKPSLSHGMDLVIKGYKSKGTKRLKDFDKDYLEEVYYHALSEEIRSIRSRRSRG